MQTNLFEMNTCKSGDYYVYVLINSLNDKVIYVGKGTGDRLYFHIKQFYEITGYREKKVISIREVNDRRIHGDYKKYSTFLQILNRGGQIQARKVFSGLEESEAYKIEKIIIFLLRRRIDYLYTLTVKGKKVNLKKRWGKLLNKSVGGPSKFKVTAEVLDYAQLLEDYKDVSSIMLDNDFIKSLSDFTNPNFIGIKKGQGLDDFIMNRVSHIQEEIKSFTKRHLGE